MSWQSFAVIVTGLVLSGMSVGACSSSSTPSGGNTPAVDPNSREGATVAKGLEAVGKRKCKDCHTDNMSGATKALVRPDITDPRVILYPPNLTPDIATGLGDPMEADPAKKGFTDDLLARAIREGYDRTDQKLCPQMQHYPDMSDFEVYSIVKYLRSLPPVPNKVPHSVCPPLKNADPTP